jgi:hypothetical protein
VQSSPIGSKPWWGSEPNIVAMSPINENSDFFMGQRYKILITNGDD